MSRYDELTHKYEHKMRMTCEEVVELLSLQHEKIERLRAANHALRGLLDTAADAWDFGQWNSLLGVQMCGLPMAWREKTREVLK